MKTPVYVREGEAAELSCTYRTPGDPRFTLEWRYAPPGTPAIQAKDVSRCVVCLCVCVCVCVCV